MTIVDAAAPARAEGLQLIGEMKGSGYRTPPALVRRADGQTVQLTPLLYAVLEEVRDGRSTEEVADRVSHRLGRTLTADNVTTLVDGQLRPLGLLKRPDGSEPELKRSNPLLGLKMKFAITDDRLTRRLTAPFAVLFNPLLAVAVTAGFGAVAWWVLLHKGLASATYEAFQHPGLLLLIVAVMLLSAGFHEFGHAAAARRGGARPGTMGAGVYLVWPAFYTDVTDSYRLGRFARIRTDLGGLYFDAMVALGIFGVWGATRWDGWLLVVAAQVLGMVRQLAPLVRFDGYHILCDVTGVPDLFQRIKPVLLSFLPRYWRTPEVAALKRWVRVVVTLWVLTVVPMLAFALVAMLLALPRIAGTAWARVREHATYLAEAWSGGDVLDVGARFVAILATALPVVAISLMLGRLAYGVGRRTWTRTRGKPVKRGVAVVVALAILGGLTAIWWPQPDRYRPIQPWERGTLTDVVPVARVAPSLMRVGYQGRASLAWPSATALPTRERPQLSLVLVPRTDGASSGALTEGTQGTVSGADGDQTWVFPFNRPLEPGEGDNQAMAVNYADGGTRYDVAFAMVWVEDGDDALNRNEAYALASCRDCTTVAVAFQVVVVVGQSDVIIPKNVSAAVNYNCLSCVTVALAQQLLVTVDRMPGPEAMRRIQDLWAELARLQTRITELSFAEIEQALDDFEVQVLAALSEDGALSIPTKPSPTATPSGSPTADADATPTGTPTPTAGTSAGSEQSGGAEDTGDSSTEENARNGGGTDSGTDDASPTPDAEPSQDAGAPAPSGAGPTPTPSP